MMPTAQEAPRREMGQKLRHADVLVIGAGPAGMAAGTAAANHGCKVLVLDDNPTAGGQIWRQKTTMSPQQRGVKAKPHKQDAVQGRARTAFHQSGAELLSGHRVVDAPRHGFLRTVADTTAGMLTESFTWDRLILATGARERFLPFPGWTLPGVFGAGGLQALVKGGFSVEGKRVVVAGTGPLLLAVAAHLQEYGAKVLSIAEQAPLRSLLPFALGLALHPGKLKQGIRYRTQLGSAPYRTGWWPLAIEKFNSQLVMRSTNGRRTLTETCDLLACGFHLVPNTELAALLGCNFNGDFVEVDEHQQTSVANIFCAGEPTGIAGLDAALVQGKIAGLSAAGQNPSALRRRCAKEHAFARRMDAAFRLRPELCSLSAPSTIVCRCEDVTFERLQRYASWTEAKLQTRCGMGACQGRICGPAVQTLFGWRPASVRPPIFPVPIRSFGNDANDSIDEQLISQETP